MILAEAKSSKMQVLLPLCGVLTRSLENGLKKNQCLKLEKISDWLDVIKVYMPLEDKEDNMSKFYFIYK